VTAKIIPAELRKAHLYLMVSNTEAEAKKDRENLRKDLLTWLQTGEVDEDGNFFYEFPEPIALEDNTYSGLMAQRRVSEYVSDEVAMKIIEAHGLEDRCLKTVSEVVVDYDEVYAANQEDIISDEEVDSMIETAVSYALVKMKR
jgi:hypothetical protein